MIDSARVGVVSASVLAVFIAVSAWSDSVPVAPPSAQAAPSAHAAAPPAPVPATAQTQIVCKMVRATGSNIPEKVCRSRAATDEERARAQHEIQEAQSKSNYNTGGEGPQE
jgi:hypothetical protein